MALIKSILQDSSWSLVGYVFLCFGIGLLLCVFVCGCACPTPNHNDNNIGAFHVKREKMDDANKKMAKNYEKQ